MPLHVHVEVLNLLKIVILSLVRNSGGLDDDMELGFNSYSRPNIGFLKVCSAFDIVSTVLIACCSVRESN